MKSVLEKKEPAGSYFLCKSICRDYQLKLKEVAQAAQVVKVRKVRKVSKIRKVI